MGAKICDWFKKNSRKAEQQKLEGPMAKYCLQSKRETISVWICFCLYQIRLSFENSMHCIYTSIQIIKKKRDLLPYFPPKHTHYMNALHGTSPNLPMGLGYYDL